MSDPLVQVAGVTRTYGRGPQRFDALRGVDLAVHRGESLAIVGKSGSGKSTLMHLMALLDRPTSGTVRVAGRDATRLSPTETERLRNRSFGFVFQQFFLVPGQTVLENAVLPLRIAGVGRSERRRRGMEILEALGMAEKATNRATDLSGGQKQRLAIARAVITEPELVFADEPTGNLDSATGATVEDLLFGLNRELGITLVVVTHDAELAARCDRQVRIQDGLVQDRPTPGIPALAGEPVTAGRTP